MNLIQLDDVRHRYLNSDRWALDGVTLPFSKGEAVLISGRNGSGKTTLLKVASLLIRPVDGRVFLDGREFWRLGEEDKVLRRRSVAYVHERPVMLSGTVLENVSYALRIRGVDDAEAKVLSSGMLEELGIGNLAMERARSLSAGQAQVISIARVLVTRPSILFLDEPFAYLDDEKTRMVCEALRRRQEEGTGIVIASHIRDPLEGYLRIGKRVVLEDGRVVRGAPGGI